MQRVLQNQFPRAKKRVPSFQTFRPAFCSDLDKGRRPGNYEEMCDYLRLIQSLNVIQQEGGGPFEAMDLPAETRHLDLYLAQIRLLDKNWQAYALGRERTIDAIEMACISLETEMRQPWPIRSPFSMAAVASPSAATLAPAPTR